MRDAYRLEVQPIRSGYDRQTCWVQARGGAIPGPTPIVVVTMQKLRLSGSDIFYTINDMRSDDRGCTWTGPTEHASLARRAEPGGVEAVPCDFNPKWHAATGKLLGTGHVARYINDELMPDPRPRHTSYSVYDPEQRSWLPWATLAMPDTPEWFSAGAGSAQRYDLPDGSILLPVYHKAAGENCHTTTVVRCAFDGHTLKYIEHGDTLRCPQPRGFCEPSITRCGDRFFLTLRNDEQGYVTSGPDGLHWDEPRPWCFDHGLPLGNYNTQQHWVTHHDRLFLTYTRRAATNDHIFRHRAPIFMAEVDQERLCVRRNTERIIVPERGARLGNFQVTDVSEAETWVIAAEWMQTTAPDSHDCTVCERCGSDNTIWAARIFWQD